MPMNGRSGTSPLLIPLSRRLAAVEVRKHQCEQTIEICMRDFCPYHTIIRVLQLKKRCSAALDRGLMVIEIDVLLVTHEFEKYASWFRDHDLSLR